MDHAEHAIVLLMCNFGNLNSIYVYDYKLHATITNNYDKI